MGKAGESRTERESFDQIVRAVVLGHARHMGQVGAKRNDIKYPLRWIVAGVATTC